MKLVAQLLLLFARANPYSTICLNLIPCSTFPRHALTPPSTQLSTWVEKGRQRLDTFLAKMGISKKECQQPYSFMSAQSNKFHVFWRHAKSGPIALEKPPPEEREASFAFALLTESIGSVVLTYFPFSQWCVLHHEVGQQDKRPAAV